MTEVPEIKTLSATKTWGRGRIYENITETIGHTPLVRLGKIAKQAGARAIRCPASRIALASP
jgi:cysteine synthase A